MPMVRMGSISQSDMAPSLNRYACNDRHAVGIEAVRLYKRKHCCQTFLKALVSVMRGAGFFSSPVFQLGWISEDIHALNVASGGGFDGREQQVSASSSRPT